MCKDREITETKKNRTIALANPYNAATQKFIVRKIVG